jgi:hypothetical protein
MGLSQVREILVPKWDWHNSGVVKRYAVPEINLMFPRTGLLNSQLPVTKLFY